MCLICRYLIVFSIHVFDIQKSSQSLDKMQIQFRCTKQSWSRIEHLASDRSLYHGELAFSVNYTKLKGQFSWVQVIRSVVSNSLQPQGLQHARPPYPSPSPRVCPSSCTLNQWCHPTISSSVTLLSLCLQSFPISGSFSMSQLFQWALSTRVKEIIWDIGSSGKYQQNEKAVNSATRPKCAGIQNRSQYGQVVHVSFCHISKEKNEDYFYNNFKD